MSAEPQLTAPGSSQSRPPARPKHKYLTTAASDPLGLAAEIYYARTGFMDYELRLDGQADPSRAFSDIDDPNSHPFAHCFVEQANYNRVIERLREAAPNPEIYRRCRYRWYRDWEPDPRLHKTSACMSLYCPACWMLKVERAYENLVAAEAPVYGTVISDWLGLDDTYREVLTTKSRDALVAATDRLSGRDRDAAWRPLYWALFPIFSEGLPGYRFAGIFVAPRLLDRRPSFPRTPDELARFGVPRTLKTTRAEVHVWERGFTGVHAKADCWATFREVTPCPVGLTDEDGATPGYPLGDVISNEVSTITWAQTSRSYSLNHARYAGLVTDRSVISEPRLSPTVLEELYADIRAGRKGYQEQVKAFREAEASARQNCQK